MVLRYLPALNMFSPFFVPSNHADVMIRSIVGVVDTQKIIYLKQMTFLYPYRVNKYLCCIYIR